MFGAIVFATAVLSGLIGAGGTIVMVPLALYLLPVVTRVDLGAHVLTSLGLVQGVASGLGGAIGREPARQLSVPTVARYGVVIDSTRGLPPRPCWRVYWLGLDHGQATATGLAFTCIMCIAAFAARASGIEPDWRLALVTLVASFAGATAGSFLSLRMSAATLQSGLALVVSASALSVWAKVFAA